MCAARFFTIYWKSIAGGLTLYMGIRMQNRTLIIYKSRTGFTKRYAEMIAEETDCTLIDFKDITIDIISGFDTIIFGSRLHAGIIDGLTKVRKLLQSSKANHFAIFVTGATPNASEETINKVWENNLTSDEVTNIPHFYMQSGLCYEKMSFPDKLMMKMVSIMLNKKKNKDSHEIGFEQAITSSYDISSKEYIAPLVIWLKGEMTNE